MADFPFRRKPEERKKEAKRAEDSHVTSKDFQNIRNKLGLSQKESDEKVRYALRRLVKKPRTWKVVGITRDDFIKFGITIENIG